MVKNTIEKAHRISSGKHKRKISKLVEKSAQTKRPTEQQTDKKNNNTPPCITVKILPIHNREGVLQATNEKYQSLITKAYL